MRWIALQLPALSLESFAATLPAAAREAAAALLEAQAISAANAAAGRLGVRPGMKRATALALAPQLRLGQADALRDAAALTSVAHAALAFTPAVSLPAEVPRASRSRQGELDARQHHVLMEVGASLRYFGGLDALLGRLRGALAPLGHRVCLASAPTAAGALLLARQLATSPAGPAGDARALHCADLAALREALQALPLGLLDAGREHREALQGMGLRTLGELRHLPRAGLARRFGAGLLDEIDRAHGERPDPRAWITLPPVFEGRLELFARADSAEQLLHGASVLLARLIAWCGAQHARVRRFTLCMQHEPRHAHGDDAAASALEIALAEPSADAAHLLALLRERLARLRLAAPTLELRLACADIARAAPPNGELFATPGSEREGLTRLIERLQARLGRERVQRLVLLHDHRPEQACGARPARAAQLDAAPARRRAEGAPLVAARPVWLLREPQPLPERDERPFIDGAALQLLSGPERIESGWWDGALAERDYFIAQQGDGSLVWVFRGRLPRGEEPTEGWYLHGRFG
jgi:protein ImuB